MLLQYQVCSRGPSLSFLFWSGCFVAFLGCFFFFLGLPFGNSFEISICAWLWKGNSKNKQSALLMSVLPFWEQDLHSLFSRSGKAHAESGWDSSPPRGILKLLLIRAQTNTDLILPQRGGGCCYEALMGNKYRRKRKKRQSMCWEFLALEVRERCCWRYRKQDGLETQRDRTHLLGFVQLLALLVSAAFCSTSAPIVNYRSVNFVQNQRRSW